MKRALLTIAALSFLPAALSAAPEKLFNGKDLSGWKGLSKFWSVKDGVIVGETKPDNPTRGNTFLVHQGNPVDDFELTLKAKITGKCLKFCLTRSTGRSGRATLQCGDAGSF